MIPFIKLIRIPNLLIIALTMYLVRYCLFIEYVMLGDTINNSIQIGRYLVWIRFTLSNWDFFLLVFSTTLIAAAGYIINDYYDVKIDAVNKPEKVILGKSITKRTGIILYTVFNIAAIIIGFYLAVKIGKYNLGLINIFVCFLLWLYSKKYKKIFLLGNIIVAFLSALVPLITAFFEPTIYEKTGSIFRFVLGYAFFAFFVSLIREIIKDIEDKEGDAEEGCKTMPVVIGMNKSKVVISFFIFMLMTLLGYIQYMQFKGDDKLSFWYFLLAIQIPFVALLYMIIRAKAKNDFTQASLLTKGIMLTGILSMYIFYLSLK